GSAPFPNTRSAISRASPASSRSSATCRDFSFARATAAACRSATALHPQQRWRSASTPSSRRNDRNEDRCSGWPEIAAAVPAELERRRILLAAVAAEARSSALRLRRVRLEHRAGACQIALVVEPELRHRDIRWHVADDARHVLVEHVGLDAMPAQEIAQEVRLSAIR